MTVASAAMSAEFLLTTLVVVATPGTGALYTIAAGLTRGAGASFVAAIGCTLGTLPHILAAVTGLAALLHTSAVAFQFVKYLGVAYLLYMAWSMLRERGPLVAEEGRGEPRSAGRVIASGVLINLLNPKLTIFFFAFLPQFVAPGDSGRVTEMLGLSAVFMLVTLVVFARSTACSPRRCAGSRPASSSTRATSRRRATSPRRTAGDVLASLRKGAPDVVFPRRCWALGLAT